MGKVGINKLLEYRAKFNLTLDEVHKATGLAISTLSKLENGKISLSPKVADILSEFFEVEFIPSRINITYEEALPMKEPHYKIMNKALREENNQLKLENEQLKQTIQKIKLYISKIEKM